jgi:magnesium-transporting ATPase (P-type)
MKKMYKDHNFVRKLSATETMGGANNICSDKTGTLTKNEMDLTAFWNAKRKDFNVPYDKKYEETFEPKYHELMKQALSANSDAEMANPKTEAKEAGSKTDIALLKFLDKAGQDYKEIRGKYKIMHQFPFSSNRKRMSTVLLDVNDLDCATGKRMHIKGASEIILASCDRYLSFETGQILNMD